MSFSARLSPPAAVLFAAALLLAATAAFPPASAAERDIPYLSGRVVDNAEILDGKTRGALAELLKAHEGKTGNQVAVLTVPTLSGENIEEYAAAVFAEWKLGRKGKDNGLLVVVVPNERRMRIEVGYGLEGTLTDGSAGRIIRNVMAPRFKAGDYDGGVTAGVEAILAVLEGGAAPPDAPPEARPGGKGASRPFFEGPDLPLAERILIGCFVFGIIGLFTVIGVLTPGAGWFLYLFLIPFWAMFPIIVVGTTGALVLLGSYLVAFPAAKLILGRTAWYEKAKADLKAKGVATIGGFTLRSGGSGASWSSGGSSSGSSGGGFSGGGGSSGGGGASGSW